MPRTLVLHGACDIISAYPSEDAARARHELLPGGRALVSETGAKADTEAEAAFVLLRAAEAKTGGALTSTNLWYNASLLRTTAQKLVRRQKGVQAATVALQYLRQLASPGAKEVNKERRAFLDRMVIVAAEDAGAVSSLAIGVFHSLGATSPAIGFGARDAFAVANCWGAIASAPRPDEAQFVELPGEPDAGTCEPTAWAMSLALRHMAMRLAVRDPLESEWLRKLEGACRAQGAPPPVAAAPLQLGSSEPLPPDCQLYFAVDHHKVSGDQKQRRAALFDALRKAVPLAAGKSDAALDKVLKPHAMRNLRDAELGVCHRRVPSCNKPMPSHAEGSWEAQVLAAWPTAVKEKHIWDPVPARAPRKRSAGEGSSSQPQKQQATLAFAPL